MSQKRQALSQTDGIFEKSADILALAIEATGDAETRMDSSDSGKFGHGSNMFEHFDLFMVTHHFE